MFQLLSWIDFRGFRRRMVGRVFRLFVTTHPGRQRAERVGGSPLRV
jgi:hypothetical protein